MTRIVVISDTHVGSSYAIFPEDFKHPESGHVIGINRWQRSLLQKWNEYASSIEPDIIFLLGDLVEGPQRRDNFATLMLDNVQHQIDAFISLFSVWRYKKLYVIRGTDYHVTTNGVHTEEIIGKRLGAAAREGRSSFYDRTLNINGRMFHIAHHVGFSSAPSYQFTPIARQGWMAKLYDEYFGKINTIIRGHVHYYRALEVSDIFDMFTSPCWQNQTPYQRKKDPFFKPDLGLIEIEVDKGLYSKVKHIFHPPKLDVEKVEV